MRMSEDGVQVWVRHLDARESARQTVRALLADYLGIRIESIGIREGPGGRPGLESGSGDFSISHAGDVVAVAAVRQGRVGIDAEFSDRSLPLAAMARDHFTAAEAQRVTESACPGEMFYRIWTAKEAFLKAAGLGLGFGMDQIETGATADGGVTIQSVCGMASLARGWSLSHQERSIDGRRLVVAVVNGPQSSP